MPHEFILFKALNKKLWKIYFSLFTFPRVVIGQLFFVMRYDWTIPKILNYSIGLLFTKTFLENLRNHVKIYGMYRM